MLNPMSKLLIVILLLTLVISDPVPQNYTKSSNITLSTKIKDIVDIGYSLDQSLLVVLGSTSNQFYMYNGISKNNLQTVTITDSINATQTSTPTCYAFNADASLIVIGTKEGSVYGFTIANGIVDSTHAFYYNMQNATNENWVRSLDILKSNPNDDIAVAGIGKVVLLRAPSKLTGPQMFQELKILRVPDIQFRSVAWSYQDPKLLLVGGTESNLTGLFSMYDVSVSPPAQQFKINTDNTFSVAFHPSDSYLLQGSIGKNVSLFDNLGKPAGSIPSTLNASQILLSSNGIQLGIQLSGKQIVCYSLVVESTKNLLIQQSSSLNSFVQKISLDLQDGSQIAITSSSNQILAVPLGGSNTLYRFNLCTDGSLYEQTGCLQCDPNCKTCYQEIKYCLTCDEGNYLDGNTCPTCASKTNACETCDMQSGFCITCNDTQGWKKNAEKGVCKCDILYYQQAQTCKLCQNDIFDCKTCDNVSTCTECYGANNYDPKPSDKGQCQCSVGYQKVQTVCKLCNTNVPGCKYCSDLDTCTQCNQAQFFVKTPNANNQCDCMAIYYLNDTKCQPCTILTGCLQCSSATNCTKCTGANRQPSSNGTQCICKETFFEDGGVCTKCDNNNACLECTDTTECKKCNTIDNWAPIPINKKCICDKTYYKNDQNKCVLCKVTGCDKCQKPDTCESCSEEKGFKPDAVTNQCSCKVGKYLNTDKCDDCVKAIPGCLTCGSAQKCDTCDNNTESHFIPNPNADNKCSCQETYFLDIDSCSSCSQAITGCENCDNGKTCQTCDTSKKFVEDPVQGKCTCLDSYYKDQTQRSCLLCSSKIQYCQNCAISDSTVTCQKCKQNLITNGDKSSCVCGQDEQIKDGRCEPTGGLSPLAIIAIIVGILAVAGGVVAVIKCCKKRKSPLEDDQYQALQENK